MWLLENDDNVFGGRRLWLRPGKTYLFGRTCLEPGMLVVADKTVSRKHITIRVDNVKDGEGRNRSSRSTVTIEDLKTKIGTFVNGTQIKGSAHVLTQPSNTLKLGHFSKILRLTWHPVVLSFSFTKRELQSDPWETLRADLEQLDIKYIADYDLQLTSHVVTKKRNTSKGLQALINGKFIVTDTFLRAVSEAAQSRQDPKAGETSLLEQDFDVNWPNPLEHLPPRGDEPSDRPVDAYAPDPRRREIFDGYTFIFYEKTQYDTLFPVITNGKGKALLREIVPHETQIDDFVRYVKEVAGESGLGEFEDGSEGKGVVVVRYAPLEKHDAFHWYGEFGTSVSLRLDHRMIDQRQFLDAILANEAGMLRRPLERATIMPEAAVPQTRRSARNQPAPEPMDVDEVAVQVVEEVEEEVVRDPTPPPQVPVRSKTTRARRRFKGFDDDDDDEQEKAPEPVQQSQGMFVSQAQASLELETATDTTGRSSRKRDHSPVPEPIGDSLEDIAPAAAAFKRRRIAAGEDLDKAPSPIPAEEDEDQVVPDSPTAQTAAKGPAKGPAKGRKKGAIDSAVLDLARQQLEEAEAKARAEDERLAQIPEDGIDAAEIRRLTLVEDMEVRPAGAAGVRSREQDVADGRWDPRWNGRPNFKKFRKHHQPAGLPRQRILVGYEVAKNKAYGIGDDYWLDDEPTQQQPQRQTKQSQTQTGSSVGAGAVSAAAKDVGRVAKSKTASSRQVVESDSDDDLIEIGSRELELQPDGDEHAEDDNDKENEEGPEVEVELPRTKKGKAAQRENTRQSQRQTQSTTQSSSSRSQATTRSGRGTASSSAATGAAPSTGGSTSVTTRTTNTRAAGKRAAAAPPAKERPAKKTRAIEVADSESDEDGGGKFRFGRR